LLGPFEVDTIDEMKEALAFDTDLYLVINPELEKTKEFESMS